jgi:general secretion pathway protein L
MEERSLIKSIGIDIGTCSIKIVEAQSTSKGVQINLFIEHTLNTLPGADHELETLEFLRNFVSKYEHSTRFIVGLKQDRVAIRHKFFPFNERLKIFKSLPFELEEDLPFSFENAIFDAKIIRFVGGGAEVLACAAPKTQVQACIQRSHDAGFEPFLISSEGTAFANTFEKWDEAPPSLMTTANRVNQDITIVEVEKPLRHLHLVVNMGHTRTLISAFEGRSLIGVRSILWGGKNIAEAIAVKYDIPYIEALKELQNKAFILTNKQGATFDQVTFSETISKSVREMTRDLSLALIDIKSEFNAAIDNIELTGGASQIQNLSAFLAKILEAPVTRAALLDSIPNVLFERTPEISAKIGVALGLAIEGFKKPRNPPLNFMRGEFVRENYEVKLFLAKWSHTFKVATAALIVLFVYASLRTDFATSLSERTQEALKVQAKKVANLKGKNASEAGIKKYIRENKKRASDLKLLTSVAGMNSALDILKKVSDSASPKSAISLDVSKIDIHDALVSMEGYVNSPQEAAALQKSLTNISTDGNIKIGKSLLGPKSGKTSFSFSFNVDRGIQKVTR